MNLPIANHLEHALIWNALLDAIIQTKKDIKSKGKEYQKELAENLVTLTNIINNMPQEGDTK